MKQQNEVFFHHPRVCVEWGVKARWQTLLRRLKHLVSALYGNTAGLCQSDALGKIQDRGPRGFLCSPKDMPCLRCYMEQRWQGSLLLWQTATCLLATPGTVLEAVGVSHSIFLHLGGVAWDVTLLQQHLPAGVQSLLASRFCTLILHLGLVFQVLAGSGITASITQPSPFKSFPPNHKI